VTLNKTELSLEEGKGTQLIATVHPVGASDKSVKWKSSDPSIATVSSKGYVFAKAEGITMITVTTVDGRKTAECSVTVDAKSPVPEKSPVLEPAEPQAQPKPNDWTEIKKQADAGDGKACYEYANYMFSSSAASREARYREANKYAQLAIKYGDNRGKDIIRKLDEKQFYETFGVQKPVW
ncbi:MAG: Ig domain-containing protein, partial [Bacteroidales bacterium]|nr:Ig domain-containing protein [Bacteroidales bacterium]